MEAAQIPANIDNLLTIDAPSNYCNNIFDFLGDSYTGARPRPSQLVDARYEIAPVMSLSTRWTRMVAVSVTTGCVRHRVDRRVRSVARLLRHRRRRIERHEASAL